MKKNRDKNYEWIDRPLNIARGHYRRYYIIKINQDGSRQYRPVPIGQYRPVPIGLFPPGHLI